MGDINYDEPSTKAAAMLRTSSEDLELQTLLGSLSEYFSIKSPYQLPAAGLEKLVEKLHGIRRLLIDSPFPTHAKDRFRNSGGFETLIGLVRLLSGFYGLSGVTIKVSQSFFEGLSALFGVLSETLLEHHENRNYFGRLELGGWNTLQQALIDTGVGSGDHVGDFTYDMPRQEQLFGLLFAFALREDSLATVFRSPAFNVRVEAEDRAEDSQALDDTLDTVRAQQLWGRTMNGTEILWNPEVVPIIVAFWTMLVRNGVSQSEPSCRLSVLIVTGLTQITRISEHNAIGMQFANITRTILEVLIPEKISSQELFCLEIFSQELMRLGLKALDDISFFFRAAIISDTASRLLLKAITGSRSITHFQFDLSLYGHASLEFPKLDDFFPPLQASKGYTLMFWIRVDKFDNSCHTTIFGVTNSNQIYFLLVYLERESHQLVLQTSNTLSKPSVIFRSVTFEEESWYHIAIVHHRSNSKAPSRALLYVNGEFREHAILPYPTSAPPRGTSGGNRPSSKSASCTRTPLQAFLGTPECLSPRLGSGVLSSKWAAASAYLFSEALSEDLILFYQKLGISYHGNYQGCLQSFQTYYASATLNLGNELLHPKKDLQPDTTAALRSASSKLNPEHNIILNISPTAVLRKDCVDDFQDELIGKLSKSGIKFLLQQSQPGINTVAFNAAFTNWQSANTQLGGVANLTGGSLVYRTWPLDDAIWRMTGCVPLALKLVDLATSEVSVIRAVRIFFELVRENWRNSEAMESENGYGILASILRNKLGGDSGPQVGGQLKLSTRDTEHQASLASQLLQIILDSVTGIVTNSQEAIIVNPLAYRVLLVDTNIWRKADIMTQRCYYNQFVFLARASYYHDFNARRLNRMRVIKKLINTLKGEVIEEEVMPEMMTAFSALVECNMSTEILRSLSLYITYALHQEDFTTYSRLERKDAKNDPKEKWSESPAAYAGLDRVNKSAQAPGGVSRLQLGIYTLQMLTGVLCSKGHDFHIKKFAKTVTNKWLLHLLAEDEACVIISSATILARLIVLLGSPYLDKFEEKTKGFIILRVRLRRWWRLHQIWTICFAILFGVDIAKLRIDLPLDPQYITEKLLADNITQIFCPAIFSVIAAMLEEGLEAITLIAHGDLVHADISLLLSVIHLLILLHGQHQCFRDFSNSSSVVTDLLKSWRAVKLIAPGARSPSAELGLDDSFQWDKASKLPETHVYNNGVTAAASIDCVLASTAVYPRDAPNRLQSSSFVLVDTDIPSRSPSLVFHHPLAPSEEPRACITHPLAGRITELLVFIFTDQICRKEFSGLGLFLKHPPGSIEDRAYLLSQLVREIAERLINDIITQPMLFCDPVNLINVGRFANQACEAVFEGWLLDDAYPLLRLASFLLQHLHRPDIRNMKNVRLCSPVLSTMQNVSRRLLLLLLSEVASNGSSVTVGQIIANLTKLKPTMSFSDMDNDVLTELLCYLLYQTLATSAQRECVLAIDIWHDILGYEARELLSMPPEVPFVTCHEFVENLQKDKSLFQLWFSKHRADLDVLFQGRPRSLMAQFIAETNNETARTAKVRIAKRQERMEQWRLDELVSQHTWTEHKSTTKYWTENISASELVKHYGSVHDMQDNEQFLESSLLQHSHRLTQLELIGGNVSISIKWQLDEVEGRDRMRMRLISCTGDDTSYKPKRSRGTSVGTQETFKSLDTLTDVIATQRPRENGEISRTTSTTTVLEQDAEGDSEFNPESFQLVDDPDTREDDLEDKNRKVMRSLQRHEQVLSVFNTTLIRGLEPYETLLIVGKNSLYLLDGLFQRSDSEIVYNWQAPQDERDPYTQIISGSESGRVPPVSASQKIGTESEKQVRHWMWPEIISISKRHFLFRDVAIEIFFADGRSYLLTTASSRHRDDLFQTLTDQSYRGEPQNQTWGLPQEDAWRIELLRNPRDSSQTIRSRVSSMFNSPSIAATKLWAKGEMSNFHYLMVINTMAGRTFNDLTQYPVFPWILADYASDELDLTNPATYRDLSKPMGCQTRAREIAFRERYQSFAEMGDTQTPAFHYGTHYSSAMIVTSYLIRLQPFVRSYLLLQGGTFDHADRLFYSVEKAWLSASRETMTDVRELTPEFFYLPDFLENVNAYNFGAKEGNGEAINHVELPPWAKGDAAIFIAKHREALESPYVSQNLNNWIDLVFGSKQRGEAAFEATNVFHYLSYHGAKDLDKIEDRIERLSTVGIIHNFGQTPRQVFSRPHERREKTTSKSKRLHRAFLSLTRIPSPILEVHKEVSTLSFSPPQRLLYTHPFKAYMPSKFNIFAEWGHIDGSMRFYNSDNKKVLGVFEQLHQEQILAATFADARTLITSSIDATIRVWTVSIKADALQLHPRASLFGHKRPVSVLAVSRILSTILSASIDGEVVLWDLNRLEIIRKILLPHRVDCAQFNNSTGHILLCCERQAHLYTLNGRLLLQQSLSSAQDDRIHCCTFYGDDNNEYIQNEFIFTGHKGGLVNIWNTTISREGKWQMELIQRLDHLDRSRGSGGVNYSSAITCVLPVKRHVYTGDEEGRVFQWDCIR